MKQKVLIIGLLIGMIITLSSCSNSDNLTSSSTSYNTQNEVNISSETDDTRYNGVSTEYYYTNEGIDAMITDPNRYKITNDDYDATKPLENLNSLAFSQELLMTENRGSLEGYTVNYLDYFNKFPQPPAVTPFNNENAGTLKLGSTIKDVDKYFRDNKIFVLSSVIEDELDNEFNELFGIKFFYVSTISHNFYFDENGILFKVDIMPEYWPETAKANLLRDDVINVMGKPNYIRFAFMGPNIWDILLVYKGDAILT